MDSLSEELLDQIVCETVSPLPNRHGLDYRDLVSISMVSRKFHRIVQPYLYRSIVISEENKNSFLHTTSSHSELAQYIHEIFMKHLHDATREASCLAPAFPSLHKLDLDLGSCKLSGLLPVLQLPSLTALCLSGVVARQIADPGSDDWGITNTTITSLDMSFSDPADWWEDCNEIWKFAAVFRKLKILSIHSDYEPQRKRILSVPVFRCLVHAFRHVFGTSLRSFTFRYNDVFHGFLHDGDVTISNALDARAILKQSHLEHLKIDTMCLHRPGQTGNLRSLELGQSCLPSSLRTLYLRHIVSTGNLNPTERNLMHSDEAQCLSQLVNLGTRRARFPHLEKMTLAISLPAFFDDVASRVVKVQARKVKMELDLILMSEWDYVSHNMARSWPQYDPIRDPRQPFYDPTLVHIAPRYS